MAKSTLFAVIGLIGLVGIGMALAGPLDPPAGPVAPTFKTLVEVEPRIAVSQANTPGDGISVFRITQPGSYYLTGNVAGTAGEHGILIAASNVTLDLNGFEVVGVTNSAHGITLSGSTVLNVAIRNGTVRGWGGDGVSIFLSGASNGDISEVRANNNLGHGINAGAFCNVRNCTARNNGVNGITMGVGGSISNSIAVSNGQHGVAFGADGVADRCTASLNGVSGIVGGTSVVIASCTAEGNGASSAGLSEGIFADNGSTIIGCTSQNNTSQLTGGVGDRGMGFRVNDRCIITDCTASRNRGHGFRLASNCRISGCSAVENGSGSTVSAGIHAVGDNNQITENHLTGSDFGVQALSAGNIITRNVARECGTAYSFVADNIYGPILDRRIPTTIPTTAAVNGFSATSTLGSTDANANYSY